MSCSHKVTDFIFHREYFEGICNFCGLKLDSRQYDFGGINEVFQQVKEGKMELKIKL